MAAQNVPTMVNMMLTENKKADANYTDLPKETTKVSWEQHGITFTSNMVDELQQDSIYHRIIHGDEDYVPGATPIPLWLMTTVEEFENMVYCNNVEGSTQRISTFHGSQRMPMFDKIIFTTTPEEAFTTFLYHLTECHIKTRHPNKAVMLSINIPLRKVTTLLSHQKLTLFLRNFLMEQIQLEADCILHLTEQEKDNQRSWSVSTTKTWTTIMDFYSWPNSFAWSFNQVRDISTICNHVDINVRKANAFFVQQVLRYSGSGIFQHLPNETTLSLLQYTQEHGINIPSTPVKDLNRIRGHPQLSKWVDENNTQDDFNTYIQMVNEYRQQEPTILMQVDETS